MDNKKSLLRRCTDKVFGGINMSWFMVIQLAINAALLTYIFLSFDIFYNTSFYKMGETFEAWILIAVFIMANCKKPLEAAVKTFVFFLISQPLIYLLQVPVSSMGWQIFVYYKTWFFWTLLTFPLAYVGWYIKKKNWVSLLILLPVIIYLTFVYVNSFSFAIRHFPHQLFAGIFCLGQVVFYLYTFVPKLWQRLTAFFAPLAVCLVMILFFTKVNFSCNTFLPDDPVFSEEAVAYSDDLDIAKVSVDSTEEYSMVFIEAQHYGTTGFTVRDGDKEYRYELLIYEDDQGHAQVKITPIGR